MTNEYVTGYRIAKILKEEYGITRPPQMVYNYIKNNLIPSEVINGQRVVRTEDAVTWMEKFSTKHAVTA